MLEFARRLLRYVPLWERVRRSSGVRHALGYEDTLWTRKRTDDEARAAFGRLDPAPQSVVEISGHVWETHGFPSYMTAIYPEYDLCNGPVPGRFDLVIAEHVFEHLLWPYRAARNVYAMLNPGGHFWCVTPFLYKVHECPHDCTRWTETGLRHLLAEAGFDLDAIQTGSWGNCKVVEASFRRDFRLYNRFLHSMRNDPTMPVVVWAMARKSPDAGR